MNLNPRIPLATHAAPPALQQAVSSVPLLPAVAHGLQTEHFPTDSNPRLVIPVSVRPEVDVNTLDHFNAGVVMRLVELANCPRGQVEEELDASFRRICQLLEIERGGLWSQLSKDATSLTLTHVYPSRENPKNEPSAGTGTNSLQTISSSKPFGLEIGTDFKSRFPWISAQLQNNRTVLFSSLLELPVEAGRDAKILRELGASAGVAIPLRSDGLVAGVNFVLSRKERNWPEATVERLQVGSQVLSYGIARRFREEKLAVALAEGRKFKTALDSFAVLGVADARGNISYVNEKFCELSKYSREELLGKDYRLLNSGHHPKEFFGELWNTLARGQVWRGDIKNRAKDGSFFWVATTIVPFMNEKGEPREYFGISFDITERKLVEEALSKSYAEIKQLKDRLQEETAYLKTDIKVSQPHGEIIGRSKAIKRVLQQVEQVAPVNCTVLITGETGTGKELIARAIHRLSARKERIMVVVNCGALPAPLVESELFGRERGAFTGALTSEVGRFEVADGSTIFLDEIGELSLDIQVKLLRVLQEREFQRLGNPRTRKVDLRVIAATNKDLAKEVREGRFREDLYYRLQVFPIVVPSLRQRMEDIPLLVSAFVEEFSSRMKKRINKIPRKVLDALERHPWPGNIRELRNIIERGVILSSGDSLLLPGLGDLSESTVHPTSLAEVEREHILKTLGDAGWRIKGPYGAAKRLHLKPSTLYSRMAKLGLSREAMKSAASAESAQSDFPWKGENLHEPARQYSFSPRANT